MRRMLSTWPWPCLRHAARRLTLARAGSRRAQPGCQHGHGQRALEGLRAEAGRCAGGRHCRAARKPAREGLGAPGQPEWKISCPPRSRPPPTCLSRRASQGEACTLRIS